MTYAYTHNTDGTVTIIATNRTYWPDLGYVMAECSGYLPQFVRSYESLDDAESESARLQFIADDVWPEARFSVLPARDIP